MIYSHTPCRDIDLGLALLTVYTPTDEFQHLFNQRPDNIGKADVFETNYRWGSFNSPPLTHR